MFSTSFVVDAQTNKELMPQMLLHFRVVLVLTCFDWLHDGIDVGKFMLASPTSLSCQRCHGPVANNKAEPMTAPALLNRNMSDHSKVLTPVSCS